jgi:thermopsin
VSLRATPSTAPSAASAGQNSTYLGYPDDTASSAVAAARDVGLAPQFVYVPRPSATPAQEATSRAAGHVVPAVLSPGPMGIGDFGLRTASNGSVEPYLLTTTSLEGTLNANATGLQPLYVLDSSPDAYSAQLNGVLVNVSLLGQPHYDFWTQDVALYYAQSHVLYLVSNVWNFSSRYFSPNAIYGHGPNGRVVGTSYYASEMKIPGVTYPFDLTLTLTSTTAATPSGTVDEVEFSAILTQGVITTPYYNFDFVEFNSVGSGGSGVSSPANYEANGFAYNALGLPDDFEFILGGPGGGSQVNFFQAQAEMVLLFLNSTTQTYQSVPSALSFGGDSGESSSGANIEWTSSTQGPFAVVAEGPSVLMGLWNAGGPSGTATIQTTVTPPSDAFVFVLPPPGPFTVVQAEWAPTVLDTVVSVEPGTYTVSASMSYYTPANETFTALAAGQVVTFAPTLTPDPSAGVTTPIWVWSNTQFPALSSGGSGTPTSPYLLNVQQSTPMSSAFGAMNDYTFPVFAGVFFDGTSATAEIVAPGPFATQIPSAFPTLPPTNDLPYVFYDESNAAVLNASSISGWYTFDLLSGFPDYATFNLVFWNSSHNLVAHDTINTESEGIYLYGGAANTVWNNSIEWVPTSGGGSFPLWPEVYSVGIQDAESGDTIYNNAVYTTLTASTPSTDPYTGVAAVYHDTWNITNSSLSVVHFAPSFPDLPLSGSIVNTTYQGGNFWWDYGQADNPLGRLPYTANKQITSGGDYVPLVPRFTVTFLTTGYTGTGVWGASLTNAVSHHVTSGTSTSTSLVLSTLLPGNYTFKVTPPADFLAVPATGVFDLFRATTISLLFPTALGILQLEVFPPNATVYVNGTLEPLTPTPVYGWYNATLLQGHYPVAAFASGYTDFVGNVTVVASTTTVYVLRMVGPPGTLVVATTPANSTLRLDNSTVPLFHGSATISNLLPGPYTVNVSAVGYYTYSNSSVVVLSGQTTHLFVDLLPTPFSNGTLLGTVSPSSAVVAVGGHIVTVGPNGAFNQSLPAGNYSVAASASGYRSVTDEVTLRSNNTTYLNLTLSPLSHPVVLSAADFEIIGIATAILIAIVVVVLIRSQRKRYPPQKRISYTAPTTEPEVPPGPAGGLPPPGASGP